MATLEGILDVTAEELQQTAGGVAGFGICIQRVGKSLRLDQRQLGIFCRHTPEGKTGQALWDEFARRRDTAASGMYGFAAFMMDVLKEAGHSMN